MPIPPDNPPNNIDDLRRGERPLWTWAEEIEITRRDNSTSDQIPLQPDGPPLDDA
jgi:hypothetical protein